MTTGHEVGAGQDCVSNVRRGLRCALRDRQRVHPQTLLQMHRLGECARCRRSPRRRSGPTDPGRGQRDPERVGSEGGLIGRGNHGSLHALAIAPGHLGDSSGKVHSTSAASSAFAPLPSTRACGINTSPVLTKKSPARGSAVHRAPVDEVRHAVGKLHVVHVEVAVEVVVEETCCTCRPHHELGPPQLFMSSRVLKQRTSTEPLLRQVHRHRLEGRSRPLLVGCGNQWPRGSGPENR